MPLDPVSNSDIAFANGEPVPRTERLLAILVPGVHRENLEGAQELAFTTRAQLGTPSE